MKRRCYPCIEDFSKFIFRWLFHWRVVLPFALFLIIILYLCLFTTRPDKHYLTNDPEPTRSIEIAKFEAQYFSYLTGITAGVLAALLALLFADKNVTPKHRQVARYGIIALLIGITFITFGYANRNLWIVTGKGLSPYFGCLDYLIIGPATAVAYIMGVYSLIELAFLQIKQEQNNL